MIIILIYYFKFPPKTRDNYFNEEAYINSQFMNKLLAPEIREIVDVVHYRPAVSIILPFDTKMGLKNDLHHCLKIAVDEVIRELKQNYSTEMANLILFKLTNIIKDLNYNTFKSSIAIYVSPIFEKVLYLDIAVEQKIIIDESFEIRDLVYSKKHLHKYLVLLIRGNESHIYLGDSTSLVRIVSNAPEIANSNSKDFTEKVSNFSDSSSLKEIRMEKYLRKIDNSLSIILQAYQLPLFIMGAGRLLGHFKSISKHLGMIVDFIPLNYEEISYERLKEVLLPSILDWKKVKQKDILNRLDQAASKNKLAIGMTNVWREAVRRKGRLLVVEKNFKYSAQLGYGKDSLEELPESYNKFSYIRDAVDDVMEKVLENGGDVEFVDAEVLKDYQHIALIDFF